MLPLILAVGLAQAGEPVSLGGPAWAFALPSIGESGRQLALHDFTGVGAPDPFAGVVVHFFMPGAGDELVDELSAFARDHKDVKVLGIIYDPRGASAAASKVRALRPEFPVLSDEHGIVFSRYGLERAPFTLVVDGDGLVYAASQPTEADFATALNDVVGRMLAD